MSIVNINTLQELSYNGGTGAIQTLSDIYLKQSLANLGQRFSIKGDGIASGHFGIYELFQTIPEPEESKFAYGGELYSAYISGEAGIRNDGSIGITLTAYYGESYTKTISLDDDPALVLSYDVKFTDKKPKTTNGSTAAYIGAGSSVTKYDDSWSIVACSYDSNIEYQETVIEEYSEEYPYINGGLKVFEVGETAYAVQLKHVTDHYILTVYAVPEGSSYGISDINDALLDPVSGFIATNDDWTIEGATEAISQYANVVKVYNNVTYDEDTQYLYIKDISATDNADTIATKACGSFNDDISITRPFVCSLYNDMMYFDGSDNLGFKKHIVSAIIAKLYNNFTKESGGDNASGKFRYWMPYDYAIDYYCNSNDGAQILSSSRGITVESSMSPESILWKIFECGDERVREQIIIADAPDITDSTEDIFTVWQFNVSYIDDKGQKYIDTITVSKMYTLPYINDDGYWNVYGTDTNIYARGKDAGQPSIILTYTDTSGEGTHEVLSSLNQFELTYLLSWEEVEYNVRPLDTGNNTGDALYHRMSTYMPVAPSYLVENYDNMMEFLKAAVIMNINSVSSEKVDESTTDTPLSDVNQLGPDAVVTTFWAFQQNETTKEYEFTCVKEPGTSWAIDFNYLTNAEAIVKYYLALGLEPDRYHFSWLVYDGVSGTLKNQPQPASKSRSYPVIMNRLSPDFDDILPVSGDYSGIYRNNLNLMPAFYTNVVHKSSYIADIASYNEQKYFQLDENGRLPIWSEEDMSSYTNVIRAYKTPLDDAWTSYEMADEWYPNTIPVNVGDYTSSLFPIVDFKEVFIRNASILNRYNILSTDEEGKMWYSYIGTSFEDADKSVTHIGTSNANINLGLKTLTTDADRKRFNKTQKLDVDFKTIAMNGDTLFTKGWWEVTDNDGTKTYSRKMELTHTGDVREVSNIDDALGLDVFTMPVTISERVSDIGNSTAIEENESHSSYINITNLIWKLIDNGTCIPGFDSETPVNGDMHSLFAIDDRNGGTAYILKLESDIIDDAQKINGTSQIVGTIQMSYQLDDTNKPSINIKEISTSSASVFEKYYGGSL